MLFEPMVNLNFITDTPTSAPASMMPPPHLPLTSYIIHIDLHHVNSPNNVSEHIIWVLWLKELSNNS